MERLVRTLAGTQEGVADLQNVQVQLKGTLDDLDGRFNDKDTRYLKIVAESRLALLGIQKLDA